MVNKFYGAVCQGLDNNLLGNCVINLCIYSDSVQQWCSTKRHKMIENNKVKKKGKLFGANVLNRTSPSSTKKLVPYSAGRSVGRTASSSAATGLFSERSSSLTTIGSKAGTAADALGGLQGLAKNSAVSRTEGFGIPSGI